MAAHITKDSIEAELATVVATGKARSSALRTLRNLRSQDAAIELDDEENIKLVIALKALGAGNLNLSTWRTWSQKIEMRETRQKRVFILSKELAPNLDSDPLVGPWLHKADTIQGNIDKTAFCFIDMNCKNVPFGAEEHICSVAHVQQTEPDQPPSGVTLLAAPAQACLVATNIAAGEEVATPQPAVNNSTSSSTSENAKAAKARDLKEQPSAPSESDITEDEWAAQMIKSVGECFEAENYHDPNPNRVTACSAFEEYKTYVKKRVAACLSEEAPEKAVPAFMQELFRFVTKCLLDRRSYTWFGPFGDVIRAVLDICPAIVPGTARAMVVTKDAPLTSTAKIDLSFLTEQQHLRLKRSKFWESFLDEQAEAMLKAAREGHTMSATERIALINQVLGGRCSEEDKGAMKIAKTMLTDIGLQSQATFIMNNGGSLDNGSARLDPLSEWCPRHRCLCLRVALPGIKYKDISATEFLQAADIFLECGCGLLEKVANPIPRALFKDYIDMMTLAKANGSEKDDTPKLVLTELVVLKLGAQCPDGHALPASFTDREQYCIAIYKVVEPTLRKTALNEKTPCLRALADVVAKAAAPPQATNAGSIAAVAPPSATGGASTQRASDDEPLSNMVTPVGLATYNRIHKGMDAVVVEQAAQPSGATLTASEPALSVGCTFTMVYKKEPSKSLYNGHLAKVTDMLTGLQLKAEVMEGPKKGEIIRYEKSKIETFNPKRKADEADLASSSQVAKKPTNASSEAEQLAQKTFGDLSGL